MGDGEYSFRTLDRNIKRSPCAEWENTRPLETVTVHPCGPASFGALAGSATLLHAQRLFGDAEDVAKLLRSLDVHASALGLWVFPKLYICRLGEAVLALQLQLREQDLTLAPGDGAAEGSGCRVSWPAARRFALQPGESPGGALEALTTDVLYVNMKALEEDDADEFRWLHDACEEAQEVVASATAKPAQWCCTFSLRDVMQVLALYLGVRACMVLLGLTM